MTTPQTTSLELSKKLRALGVPQKSCFYWKLSEIQQKYVLVDYTAIKIDHSKKPRNWDYPVYSAYLSDQIGRWLPINFSYSRGSERWHVRYWSANPDPLRTSSTFVHHIEHESMVEAMALMLIYLIENGYIDVKSLKNV